MIGSLGWITTTLITTTLLTLFIFLKRKLDFWKNLGVPYIPGSFPFGSIRRLATFQISTAELFKEFYDRGEGQKYVGYYTLFKRSLMVRDPELIKNILVKDFSTFVDRGVYHNLEDDPLSGHLFSIEGDYWKNLRNKLSPTFTSGKMKTMYGTVRDLSVNLRNYAKQKAAIDGSVEMKNLTGRFGLDVIANVALGLEGNNFNDENSVMKRMTEMMIRPTFFQYMKTLMSLVCKDFIIYTRIRLTPKPVEDFFMRLIKKNIEYREKMGITRKDFMQLLIDLKDTSFPNDKDISNGERHKGEKLTLTLEEIAAQSFVFVLAGFETSSVTLGFLLYELASHPEIQEKLYRELEAASADLSYDVLLNLPYLDMILSETLRKHPPVPILQRQSKGDYKLPDGKVLPADTLVIIPVYGLHHDPKLFPNPEKFIPERFSKENQDKIVPYSYLPFGEGPRNCIGMRFGKMQIKLAVASILLHFRIKKSPKTVEPILIENKSFTYNAKGGIWLKLVERKK
ncbi:hypothetical protein LSTR_LSTR000757 [Laodelphax striatellus]|uniref:Cytochrome P450 n=1 Tax=Laodelphax striatellus TaxID=195883 RepID=A0A482XFJ1_LAOST|nr:hypothetical protein LSTR_LSTR000757 [Laodelphax striatellus]